jgi:hypothetical protein
MKQNAAGLSAQIVSSLLPSLNQYIGALQEIINNGSLIDKIKFFSVGYINPDVSDKVTDYATRTAQLREELKRLQAQGKDTTEVLARLNKLYAGKVGEIQAPPRKTAAETAPTKTVSAVAKADPLAGLLKSTDIGRIKEFEQTVALLNQRFNFGKKDAELYAQAMTKVVESTFGDRYKMAEDLAKEQQRLSDYFIDQIEAENDAIYAQSDAWKEAERSLIDMVDPVNELVRKLTDLDKLEGFVNPDVLMAAKFAINEQIDALNNIEPALEKTRSLAEDLGLTFTSAFEDAIVGGKAFSDILKGLEQDILRIITRKLVTEPLGNALTGFLGGIIPSANGNVFNSASLSAYSGRVVSTPTIVPFAAGGALFGEAGPEAIMPLKRGRNGKLGVESSGGGTVIHMHINTPDANSFRKSTGQITAQVSGALSRARRNM